MNNWIKNMDKQLDSIGAKLEKKEVLIPTDLAAAVVFFLVGMVLLFLVPSQVTVGSEEVVSGAAFPTYLCYLMIGGSVLIMIQNILKIVRKETIETKAINAFVEVKAFIIFGILVVFWLICSMTDLFVIGAIWCAIAFLVFFRCKKKLYYFITITVAVSIWAAFRFILNVNF